MTIFKFYQIYRSIKEELGEEMTNKLFPEYLSLPDKMPALEQMKLGKMLMDRLDVSLDKETVIRIRQKHTCNPTKQQLDEITELKTKTNNLDEFFKQYTKIISPGFVNKEDNLLTVSFGWKKCVCGMFRKLDNYEPVSKTWCECCNGHVIKTYSMICEKVVNSEIVETVVNGGKDCNFKVTI